MHRTVAQKGFRSPQFAPVEKVVSRLQPSVGLQGIVGRLGITLIRREDERSVQYAHMPPESCLRWCAGQFSRAPVCLPQLMMSAAGRCR